MHLISIRNPYSAHPVVRFLAVTRLQAYLILAGYRAIYHDDEDVEIRLNCRVFYAGKLDCAFQSLLNQTFRAREFR